MEKWNSYLPNIKKIVDDFEEDSRNSECFIDKSQTIPTALKLQKEHILSLFEAFGTEGEEEMFKTCLSFCIQNEIPYLYVGSLLAHVAKSLFALLIREKQYQDIHVIDEYFNRLEYSLSEGYYHHFLRKLASKNHLRLAHLSQLVEKHLMIYYQHHLEWMLVLISQLEGTCRAGSGCELDHNLCEFGQWLHNPTIPYITKSSHFNDIKKLHILLHELAGQILEHFQNGHFDHKTMIQLLQRLDYTSLEIGNEIAIINDMLIIGEYSKDPLTGLLGRRLFDTIMINQIEIAKATESNCALIMCDLDHFKTINDTYGHPAGDEVIKSFSAILLRTLRKSDFIFRFGGEEFMILLPSTQLQEALVLARNFCRMAAEEHVALGEISISYTVSIGVCGINTANLEYITKHTIEEYVKAVDAQLYLAKQNGRNRVE